MLRLSYKILALDRIHILTQAEVDQVASDLLPNAGGGEEGRKQRVAAVLRLRAILLWRTLI